MDNVIDFKKYLDKKKGAVNQTEAYIKSLDTIDLYKLFDEMQKFKDLKVKDVPLTNDQFIRGIALFRVLSVRANSEELKKFSKSFFNHLTLEYAKRDPVA